jgi:hypothetical protein
MSQGRTTPQRTIVVVAALAIVLGGAVAAALLLRKPPSDLDPPRRSRNLPPDPRLLYEGPFTNIHPNVAYVEDNTCTSCHSEIAESFHRHPMGRSLQPIENVSADEVYDTAHNNPFQALGAHFLIEREGRGVRHKITFADVPGQSPIGLDLPVHFAIGSGSHGRSYINNRDGYLFQTPISWYSRERFWNLAPGFRDEHLSGRPVVPDCLFCHANRTTPRAGTLNRYDAPIFSGHSIGCQRCHGPGERHIETAGKFDIVNPCAKVKDKPVLTPALRDAVCEQCHLEGEERVLRRGRGLYDYRPGLPLSDFLAVFVSAAEPGGEFRAVSHVEQMHQSRCYLGGKDDKKMGCVSCHDPHVFVGPGERVGHYRQRCQKCHNGQDNPLCNVPITVRRKQQADDSCIACHMRPFDAADIAHTAATDHRIPRRPSPQPKKGPHAATTAPRLVPFQRDRPAGGEMETARDLGLAIVQSMGRRQDKREPRGTDAVTLLEGALQNDAEDVAAWRAKGDILKLRGRKSAALAAFESALSLAPEDESSLLEAGALAQDLGRLEESLDYWRRAIAVDPWLPAARRNFAVLLEHAGRWDESRTQCESWLRLQPNSVEARKLRINCLMRVGEKAEARAEFARIESLKPANIDELRAWFKNRVRK